ncbi:MAG: family 20 glycosylhydrolase [Actinomycetota bacterium]|nr:family 20 glycosylhydrolase [Actinomycetota bacterium]
MSATTETVRLETVFDRTAGPDAAIARLTLVNDTNRRIGPFELALTSIVPLVPGEGSGVRVVERVSVYHVVAGDPAFVLEPGAALELGPFTAGFPVRHANDGPSAAYLVDLAGNVLAEDVPRAQRRVLTEVEVAPCATTPEPGPAPVAPPARPPDGPLVLPWPDRVEVAGESPVRRWALAGPDGFCEPEWTAVRDLVARLFPGEDERLLAAAGESADDRAGVVTVVRAPAGTMAEAASRLRFDGDAVEVTVAAAAGLRAALVTLAQLVRAADLVGGPGRVPTSGVIEDAPRYEWRGLHLDVARSFRTADEVARVIDLAAWRKLNRLHLHLTDDEGWRLPVLGYPALTDIGAWRGHGRAVPPLLGSGPEPTGGSYTAADIAGWRRRADALGVVMVPEIDLPGHGFAALAAVPDLRDPDDAGGYRSVQGFTTNVLNPGVDATWPFLRAALGAVADLFDPPWIHVGGDEVPAGAWDGSPAAGRWAVEHGVSGTDGIAAAFMAGVVDLVRTDLGREVGVWEEAAASGALGPGEGYVVPWQSSKECRDLLAAGHTVVAAPAERCYLDQVSDDHWTTPGLSWAGAVPLEAAHTFDPAELAAVGGVGSVLGLQACLWSEVTPTAERVDDQLVGRLDALAERAWSPPGAGDLDRVATLASIAPRLARTGLPA